MQPCSSLQRGRCLLYIRTKLEDALEVSHACAAFVIQRVAALIEAPLDLILGCSLFLQLFSFLLFVRRLFVCGLCNENLKTAAVVRLSRRSVCIFPSFPRAPLRYFRVSSLLFTETIDCIHLIIEDTNAMKDVRLLFLASSSHRLQLCYLATPPTVKTHNFLHILIFNKSDFMHFYVLSIIESI